MKRSKNFYALPILILSSVLIAHALNDQSGKKLPDIVKLADNEVQPVAEEAKIPIKRIRHQPSPNDIPPKVTSSNSETVALDHDVTNNNKRRTINHPSPNDIPLKVTASNSETGAVDDDLTSNNKRRTINDKIAQNEGKVPSEALISETDSEVNSESLDEKIDVKRKTNEIFSNHAPAPEDSYLNSLLTGTIPKEPRVGRSRGQSDIREIGRSHFGLSKKYVPDENANLIKMINVDENKFADKRQVSKEDFNGLHPGSHDGHHPEVPASVPVARKHNIEIFHPGLQEQMKLQNANSAPSSNKFSTYDSNARLPIKISPEAPLPVGNSYPEDEPINRKNGQNEHEKSSQGLNDWIRVDGLGLGGDDDGDDSRRKLSFTLFTIANTDIGTEYLKLPYREKYMWQEQRAPCHSFDFKIPDERYEHSVIKLCIFRPALDYPDEIKLFLTNFGMEMKRPRQKVVGYVVGKPESSVYGRIVDRNFYGEVSITDEDGTSIFVADEINLLNKLMRNNLKSLKHMLIVMNAKEKDKSTVYNAVVAKGASLINFMTFTNPSEGNRNAFMMFSTNHNSYILSGNPQMIVDSSGQMRLESGTNKIQVDNDGSVRMNTLDKEYTFRPNGRTIVKDGTGVRTLQEHEGSVAITAYTSSSSYDCVLPTPAFQPKRKGGYICKMCIVADQEFKEIYIKSNVQGPIVGQSYLGKIIDRVSWMFRSMDINGDKVPDNIGLDYDPQILHWNYPSFGDGDLSEQDTEILYQSLDAFDFSTCCLGIAYTMKRSAKDNFMRRPTGQSGYKQSGVCARDSGDGRISNNIVIISARDTHANNSGIGEKQLIYLTANRIAQAFGASPDGSGQDTCDQFVDKDSVTRHYLMWPEVLRNTTIDEQSLSSCSKYDITATLSTCKASCFESNRHPFCGNGIIEEGEECDCGSEQSCSTQKCCYSRIGEHPCRKSGIGCKSTASSLVTSGISFVSAFFLLIVRN